MADTSRSSVVSSVEAPPSLERSVAIGVIWKFIGQAGVQGTRFLVVAILARLLTPTDYGQAAIAVALASYAPTLGDMGMGAALVQTGRDTTVVRATAFFSSLGFGIAMSTLFLLAAFPIGLFLGDPQIGSIVAVGALTFAIYAAGAPSQAARTRAMEFRGLELRYMLALLVAGAVSVAAAAVGLGAWALVGQQIAVAVVFVVALWFRALWYPTFEFSVPTFRRLSAFALRVAGGRWARLAELLLLSLLIGRLLSVTDLGAWTFAMSAIILPLTVISIPISEVLFSAFSRMKGQRERISALWLESLGILAAAVMPFLVGLIVVAPDLIPLVFGDQWTIAVPLVQILSCYAIVRTLQSWNTPILDAAGRPHVTMWTQIAALCLTPLAVVLGSNWGIEAVAALFVLGQLLAVEIPSFLVVRSELRLSTKKVASRLSGVFAACVIMATACLLVRWGLGAAGASLGLRAAVTVLIGVIVYSASLSVLAPDIRRRSLRLVKRGSLRQHPLAR